MKTGTFKELNVKPGDVVECVLEPNHNHIGKLATIQENGWAMFDDGCFFMPEYNEEFNRKYRIISRADDTPTLWRDMTPEEKGALLLAQHEGMDIEWHRGVWQKCGNAIFSDRIAYRIKPQPKVETVTLYLVDWGYASAEGPEGANHSITLTIRDGKPDPASIKMEEL